MSRSSESDDLEPTATLVEVVVQEAAVHPELVAGLGNLGVRAVLEPKTRTEKRLGLGCCGFRLLGCTVAGLALLPPAVTSPEEILDGPQEGHDHPGVVNHVRAQDQVKPPRRALAAAAAQ
eukprot:CAMPEP_0172607382 /NCGR_PEP_ID=MMETSP1068-20121228/27576_1 /TAXON_ID=35684 /ORGANISM="Pseudopedinella elastica, Strain CCMP716" /LENGTH=119 /DNA_ID=CAMNT_0013410365 /DNA_START=42 /DNA_END=401 /DNA_ORIENTATION=-